VSQSETLGSHTILGFWATFGLFIATSGADVIFLLSDPDFL